MKKRILSLILVLVCIFSLLTVMCTQANAASTTRTIKDMDGNTVQIPAKVNSVGTSWPGFCNVLFTVGVSNKLVAASKQINNYPWSTKIFPKVSKIAYPFSSSGVNLEELLKNKPDVVFLRKGDPIDKVKEAGIPVVMIDYTHNSMSDMTDAVMLAGEVMGDQELKLAKLYKSYVQDKISTISKVTSKLTQKQKPKVLYLSVNGEISVWGRNMPQDEAITLAGGINVAAKDIDGYKPVSVEQVLVWNPDVIVVEGNAEQRKVLDQPAWKALKAVKNKKMYVSPYGVFAWARLGSECALQLPWLAKTLNPDKFKTLDMNKEIRYFYKTFFSYNLTDKEISKILSAENP